LPNRRQFLSAAGLMGAGAVLASCAPAVAATTKTNLDAVIGNFALNLEYLEAAFYLAAVGRLSELKSIGGSAQIILPTGFDGNTAINFGTDAMGLAVKQYANEIANDELAHVKALRGILKGAAVDRPVLDIGPAFAAAANAAANATLSPAFSPYGGALPFLIGAFIFEDVGVTAYHGAARFIVDDSAGGVLDSAAGILAVEAYHASEVRTLLYQQEDAATGYTGVDVKTIVKLISDLRAKLGNGKDQGIVDASGNANIVPTDANAIAFGRTPREVANIVFGAPNAGKGLFFPSGLSGAAGYYDKILAI